MGVFNFTTAHQRELLAEYEGDREACVHDLAYHCSACRTPYDSREDIYVDDNADQFCSACIDHGRGVFDGRDPEDDA